MLADCAPLRRHRRVRCSMPNTTTPITHRRARARTCPQATVALTSANKLSCPLVRRKNAAARLREKRRPLRANIKTSADSLHVRFSRLSAFARAFTSTVKNCGESSHILMATPREIMQASSPPLIAYLAIEAFAIRVVTFEHVFNIVLSIAVFGARVVANFYASHLGVRPQQA